MLHNIVGKDLANFSEGARLTKAGSVIAWRFAELYTYGTGQILSLLLYALALKLVDVDNLRSSWLDFSSI